MCNVTPLPAYLQWPLSTHRNYNYSTNISASGMIILKIKANFDKIVKKVIYFITESLKCYRRFFYSWHVVSCSSRPSTPPLCAAAYLRDRSCSNASSSFSHWNETKNRSDKKTKVISIMWELTDKLNFFQVWKVGKDKPAVFVVNQSLLCVTSPSNNVSYISSLKPDRNLLFLQRR